MAGFIDEWGVLELKVMPLAVALEGILIGF
jgi:hypothetical protein